MPIEPTFIQWIVALILLAIFSWALLGLVWDLLPTPWIDADKPQKKVMGIVLSGAAGLLSYSMAKEVLMWVWMGLRHLLGMDMEGL